MKLLTLLRRPVLLIIMFTYSLSSYAQNCTLTAGADQLLCEQNSTTLVGSISGTFDPATILWTQTGGPAVTITAPSSATTTVTGLTPGNLYTFSLQATCTIGGTVSDLMTVDNQLTPVISAGPDDSLCISGSTTMNATLPAGYTGTWSTSSGYIQFSNVNDPNATVTSTNNCPWNPTSTLTWTVSNGVCSVSDAMTLTLGIDLAQTSFPSTNEVICQTSYSAVIWCAHLANSTISFTPIINPSGATPTASIYGQNSILISVNGLNALGLHQFQVSLTSDICGGTLIDTISFTIDDFNAPDAHFSTNVGLSYGQGGPQYYDYCLNAFSEDTIWMYANTATPTGGTSTWTNNNGGNFWPYTIDDPTADTTFMVFNGGAFSPGSLYYIRRSVVTAGGCDAMETHGVTFFDTPNPITTTDTIICIGDAVNMGLAEGFFPIHRSNGNYPLFVLSSSTGIITQIGGPPATISRIYQNNANLLDDYFRFSGLTQGNIYTFVYSLGNNSSTFDYYNCYSGPLQDTFTITYAAPVGAATGTDQLLSCSNSSTGLVGIEGVGQNGIWSFSSGPTTPTIVDVNDPSTIATGMTVDGDYYFYWTVSNPCETRVDSIKVTIQNGGEPLISVTDLPNCIGDIIDLTSGASVSAPGTGPLYYTWEIAGAPVPGQNITGIVAGQTTYVLTVMDSSILCLSTDTLHLFCPLPVELIRFEGELLDYNRAELSWSTASEIDNDYFILERSINMHDWDLVDIVKGVGNSSQLQNYSYVDKNLLPEMSYYRLTQVDFSGNRKIHSEIAVINRSVMVNLMDVYPVPTSGELTITFSDHKESISQLALCTLTGQIVVDFEFNISGVINVDLNAMGVSQGHYLLIAKIGEKTVVKRVILY